MLYQEWQGGLVADIDLLGVLEPFRRSGLALALVQHVLQAAPRLALQYGVPAVGVISMIDFDYAPIVQLHRKQGGQIRRDYRYPWGDVLAWVPLQPQFTGVETLALVEQMQRFGRLLESC